MDSLHLKRHRSLQDRRFLSSECFEGGHLINKQQVEDAAKAFATKKKQRKHILQKLTYALGVRPELIQYFIKINTSLPTLISLLSGHDAQLQLEALCCLTNITAGNVEDTNLVCKMAAPYLVTYLGGDNPQLQDQCAWCVGNLVIDNDDRASYLISLGVLHLLVQLLQSTSTQVIKSSAFALVNFAQSKKVLSNVFTEDLLPALERHLIPKEENWSLLLEIAWLLFYLTTKSEYLVHIRETQIPEKTALCFINIARTGIHRSEIITPLVRSLGNICCMTDLTSRVLQHDKTLTQLSLLISDAPDVHVRKESMWLLTNIAASSAFCGAIMTSGLLRIIVYSLASTTDIKIQACLCLCNLLSHSKEYCHLACQEGVLQSLVPLISHPDVHVTMTALWLTELLITTSEYLSTFDQSHGKEALEKVIKQELTDTCQNDVTTLKQVSAMAQDLMRQYYQC